MITLVSQIGKHQTTVNRVDLISVDFAPKVSHKTILYLATPPCSEALSHMRHGRWGVARASARV